MKIEKKRDIKDITREFNSNPKDQKVSNELVFEKYCSFCGISIEISAKFCSNCGISLERDDVDSKGPNHSTFEPIEPEKIKIFSQDTRYKIIGSKNDTNYKDLDPRYRILDPRYKILNKK